MRWGLILDTFFWIKKEQHSYESFGLKEQECMRWYLKRQNSFARKNDKPGCDKGTTVEMKTRDSSWVSDIGTVFLYIGRRTRAS